MRRALRLAARGVRSADPNPAVGCVVVREGQIIGEGWHRQAGGAHAEIHALQAAGSQAAGSTVYVTLEPCAHFGRTPPCVDALVQASVGRVVMAALDPNPLVAGGGRDRLTAAGIEVSVGVGRDWARVLNRGFYSRFERGRPWLVVKWASSLDGRAALSSGESQWITGPIARAAVHRARARASAVMTGVGTVIADDPQLNVRLPKAVRQPLRVILDSHLRTPPDARLFDHGGSVHVFCVDGSQAARDRLERRGATVHVVAAEPKNRVDVGEVLKRLAQLEVNSVWAEAGPELAGSVIDAGWVDEIEVYFGPHFFGPGARASVLVNDAMQIEEPSAFRLRSVHRVAHDVRVRLEKRQSSYPN